MTTSSLRAPLPMTSPHSQSPMDKEQARQRREALQKVNMQQQALRIAQQRDMAARQKTADAARTSTPQKPLSARSVYTPPQPPNPAQTPKPFAPQPEPAAPAAPVVRARAAKPAAPPSTKELEEMRAEMQEFAHDTPQVKTAPAKPRKTARTTKPRMTVKAPPPPIEDPAPEISVDDLVIESEGLRLAPQLPPPLPPSEPSTLEISVDNLSIESPSTPKSAPLNPESPAKPATFKLKMAKSAVQNCPKCGWLLPDSQRGSFYTECRRCGEIINTDAA